MVKKIETINNGSHLNSNGYNKIESWDAERTNELSSVYYRVLKLLGEDPDREGLKNTPERVAKAMQFMTMGYSQNPCEIINSAKFREEYRQMVIVKDIDFYSLCEHHMLPFSARLMCIYPMVILLALARLPESLKHSAGGCRYRKAYNTDQKLPAGLPEPSWCCSCNRSTAYVHADQGVQKQNSVTTIGIYRYFFGSPAYP